MNQDARAKIQQLVNLVNQAYSSRYPSMDGRNEARQEDLLRQAQKLCAPIINSLNQPERHYYCTWCGEFQPVEESDQDLICTECRLVLITFREELSIQDRLRASDASLADWVAGMVE